jgi:hypothetical protein
MAKEDPMSTSLTVVVEKQPEGQSLYLLPHVVHGLDALAAQLGLAPFSSFVREDPELFAEIAEELDEETRARFAGQIQAQKDWHEPSAALATIEGLLAHLRKADARKLPADFHEAESAFAVRAVLQEEGHTLVEAVCKELQDCAEQLRQALKNSSRFHFDIG